MIKSLIELHGPEIWDIVPISQRTMSQAENEIRKHVGLFVEGEDVESVSVGVHEKFCHLLGMDVFHEHNNSLKENKDTPIVASLLHLACHLKTDFLDDVEYQFKNVEYHAPMKPSW